MIIKHTSIILCSQWGPPELGNISSPVNYYTIIFGKFSIFGAEKAPKGRTALTKKDTHTYVYEISGIFSKKVEEIIWI